MKTKMNASRFFLLTFCLLMMSSLKVASATKYGFWVGGVEVTSDNYLNITGSNITSGTVEYNPNINTLTLTNCTITRTGDNNHAIENNSCENLRIEFVGINNLSARDASAVRFETSGGLSVISGTTTLLSENQEGIYLYSKDKTERRLSIGGPGTINIKSTNDCGIEGNLRDGKRYFRVEFAKAKAIISGKKGDLVDILEARAFNNSEVTLKATNNSNYPNVKNTELLFTQSELMEWMHDHNFTIDRMAGFSLILKPWGTYKSADGKLLYNNSEIYNQDIVFSNCWSFLLNSDFFPDANFLSYLKTTKFPNKNYLTKSEVDGCTSLSMNSKSISSLKGIRFFPALKKLYCSSNNLSELDLSSNPELTELYCSSNNLSELDLSSNPELTELYCSNNKLKTLSGIGSKITKINCSNNKFEKLLLNSKPSLTSLICSNNSSLEDLRCYEDNLTTLDCTNCGNLTMLDCYSNKLTELNLTGCPNLETIFCFSNQLTELNLTGCPNLSNINCGSNLFENLWITDLPKLTTLGCSDNKKLRYLDCSRNALTSLDVYACNNLNGLLCSDNQFTTLSITGYPSLLELSCCNNPKLVTLECFYNALSEDRLYVSGCTALETLHCHYNQLKSIDLTDCTNLRELTCYHNQLVNLDVSKNKELRHLDCQSNQIVTDIFDLSEHINLTYLDCSKNKIGKLIAGNGSPLTTISCEENQMSALVFHNLNSLLSITCYGNQLTESKTDEIIRNLPDRMSQSQGGKLNIISPSASSEHNVITQAQVQAAWNKNWKTYQNVNGSWTLYEGSSNGVVTGMEPAVSGAAEDATPLYNLSGQRVDKNYKGVVIRNNKKVRMK